MRGLFAGTVVLLLAAPLTADERLDVRVLYCGDPGSARETDYHSFLARHFTKVTLRDAREFKEKDADGHDVIIFDWSNGYDGKGGIDQVKRRRYHSPRLSMKFTRPTILVGWAGGSVSNPLKLKIDWLCLCLTGPAHHLRLDHPLLHSPLEVDPKLEQMPTPEDYPYLTIDPALGPTMKVWKVQTKDYPDIDPGLVSTLYGFTDSPDAEVFAQGIAMKGPDTVTLARQANFFLWGFSAPPADMTPAAQRLFVNAVCYMRQFDGQPPLVRSESQSREWALRRAAIPRYLSEDYKQRESRRLRAMYKQHPEWIPKEHKGNLDTYIAKSVQENQASEKQWMEQALPAPLRKQFGTDGDKYVAYYRGNLEFLHPEGKRPVHFVVDEDAKAVGPSNRSVEMLARCVSKLEKKEQPDLALRLLKRYTQEKFATASQWRVWLDANRSRLFFSDVGGYKFFLAQTKMPARPTTLSTRK
jgi:hypothetical protein